MKMGLLLVDIQNDYFPGGKMELVGMTEAAHNAKKLLDAFRLAQLPTYHIQHVALREGATFFLPNTAGVKIHASIKPEPGEAVITKHFPNSFRETDLLADLKSAEVGELVICGAMSHMCIDATARAAADYGFRCLVVHDACATQDLSFAGTLVPARHVQAAFMSALAAASAQVISTEEFLDNWRRS